MEEESDRIMKLSAQKGNRGAKKVEKLLKKYLTKGIGCDIIVESPKSKRL